jgi:hypothetical protein
MTPAAQIQWSGPAAATAVQHRVFGTMPGLGGGAFIVHFFWANPGSPFIVTMPGITAH